MSMYLDSNSVPFRLRVECYYPTKCSMPSVFEEGSTFSSLTNSIGKRVKEMRGWDTKKQGRCPTWTEHCRQWPRARQKIKDGFDGAIELVVPVKGFDPMTVRIKRLDRVGNLVPKTEAEAEKVKRELADLLASDDVDVERLTELTTWLRHYRKRL